MKSRVIHRPRRRTIRVPVIVGACIAAIVLPGHILAESFGDASQLSATRPAGVDVAAVAPSYDLSPKAPTINDAGFDEPTGALATAAAMPSAQTQSGFNLSQVERIRVRVWGIPDLGGEYAIDPDSSLSFPRIGRIEIGTMSAAALEQMLAAKLSDLARTEVAVAVEVAKFRPYFIMGQVVEAGAKEWAPGLKIIQAISLARGVIRPSSDPAHAGAFNSLASRQSQTQLTFALAQLERLKAEREGTDSTAASERIETLISSTQGSDRGALSALVTRQNDMLSEQRKILETQLAGLHHAREAAERELQTAQSQQQSVSGQLEITRDQLKNLESLKEKRLISNSRFFEQKSQLLSAEIRSAESRAMVERARARLSEIDQQIALLPQQRRASLNERIDALEREVAQLRLAAGPQGGAKQQDVLKLKYNIAREGASGVQMIAATVFTEIMPGDVVIVSEGQDATVAAIETAPSTMTSRQARAAETAQRMIEDAAVEPTSTFLQRAASSPSLSGR